MSNSKKTQTPSQKQNLFKQIGISTQPEFSQQQHYQQLLELYYQQALSKIQSSHRKTNSSSNVRILKQSRLNSRLNSSINSNRSLFPVSSYQYPVHHNGPCLKHKRFLPRLKSRAPPYSSPSIRNQSPSYLM